ncbi:GrpB family protein [Thermoanaerobacterium thermosaccharolyticum]|uniref:GrpB family protein n=1 Tax=Thermoanaerobacterium thermosaccharolyticum TaxID=1517 RepID=UPI003DA996E2
MNISKDTELENCAAQKLGLKRGVVKIAPFCDVWKQYFEEEKELLYKLLGTDAVDIQHIGSTAVPGLSAKPIIDIMVGVKALNDGLKHVETLEKQGYEFRGEAGIPGRLFFAKGSPEFRTHHLHMVEYKSDFWINHLLFRDYLIQHSDTAKEYERVKMGLAQKYEFDREAYTEGKSEFIQEVLRRARTEKKTYFFPLNLDMYCATDDDGRSFGRQSSC